MRIRKKIEKICSHLSNTILINCPWNTIHYVTRTYKKSREKTTANYVAMKESFLDNSFSNTGNRVCHTQQIICYKTQLNLWLLNNFLDTIIELVYIITTTLLSLYNDLFWRNRLRVIYFNKNVSYIHFKRKKNNMKK